MITLVRIFLCFFFFQAEDGIRDGRVTGVQTSALPISIADMYELEAADRRAQRGSAADASSARRSAASSSYMSAMASSSDTFARPWSARARHCVRSEEQRVGRECRCRGSPASGKEREKR